MNMRNGGSSRRRIGWQKWFVFVLLLSLPLVAVGRSEADTTPGYFPGQAVSQMDEAFGSILNDLFHAQLKAQGDGHADPTVEFLCAAYFAPPTPCDLLPEQSLSASLGYEGPEPASPDAVEPITGSELGILASCKSVRRDDTQKLGQFAHVFNRSETSSGLIGRATVTQQRPAGWQAGTTTRNVMFQSATAVRGMDVGTTRAFGRLGVGWHFYVDMPSSQVLRFRVDIPWAVVGQSEAVAGDMFPLFGSIIDPTRSSSTAIVSKPRVRGSTKNTTRGTAWQETAVRWNGIGASAETTAGFPRRQQESERGSGTLSWELDMRGGEVHAFTALLASESIARTPSPALEAGAVSNFNDEGRAWRIRSSSYTVTILTDGWYFPC